MNLGSWWYWFEMNLPYPIDNKRLLLFFSGSFPVSCYLCVSLVQEILKWNSDLEKLSQIQTRSTFLSSMITYNSNELHADVVSSESTFFSKTWCTPIHHPRPHVHLRTLRDSTFWKRPTSLWGLRSPDLSHRLEDWENEKIGVSDFGHQTGFATFLLGKNHSIVYRVYQFVANFIIIW